MRVPLSWLREYVPVEVPLDVLAEKLSVATAEVEGVERIGVSEADGNLDRFRVGRVLENVGLDPAEWSGFAFGCGIERVAQLRHDFPDIRALWEGDLRVLRQF